MRSAKLRSAQRRSDSGRSVSVKAKKTETPDMAIAPEPCLIERRDVARFNVERRSRSSVLPTTGRALASSGFLAAALLSPSTQPVQAQDGALFAQSITQDGPRVSIMSPGYADVLKGTTSVVVSAKASRYPVAAIEMFVDGKSATGGPVKVESASSIPFNWDTSLFADGPHRLTVRVTDTQGFRSDAEVQIYINNGRMPDSTPPALKWLNIRPGDALRGDKEFRLEASDNFGIKYVWMSIRPAMEGSKPVKMSMINRPPYVFPFDTRSVPDGLYILDAYAWDALENEGKSSPVLFGVSNNELSPTQMKDLDNARRQFENAPKSPSLENPGVKPVANNALVATKSANAKVATGPQKAAPSSGSMTVVSPQKYTVPTKQNVVVAKSNGAIVTPRLGEPKAPVATAAKTTNQTPQRVVTVPKTERVVTAAPAEMTAVETRISGAIAETAAPSAAAVRESRGVRETRLALNEREIASSTERIATLPKQASTQVAAAPSASMMETGSAPSHISETEVAPRLEREAQMRLSRLEVAPRKVETEKAVEAVAPQPERVVVAPVVETSPAATLTESASVGTMVAEKPLAVQPKAELPSLELRTDFEVPEHAVEVPKVVERVAKTPVQPRTESRELTAQSTGSTTLAARAESRPGVERNAVEMRGDLLAALPKAPQVHEARPTAAITVKLGEDVQLPPFHKVNAGETLQKVANRYGVPLDVLASANGFKNLTSFTTLKPGMKLALPRPLNVRYAGKPVGGDVGAFMVGNTGVAPFRFMFEQQGGSLKWDEARGQVVAKTATQEVTITIGSRKAIVNNEEQMMDLAAFLLSGRTMVPLRFFETAMHAQVQWEPTTGRIYLTMANPENAVTVQ